MKCLLIQVQMREIKYAFHNVPLYHHRLIFIPNLVLFRLITHLKYFSCLFILLYFLSFVNVLKTVMPMLREHSTASFFKHCANVTFQCSLNVPKQFVPFKKRFRKTFLEWRINNVLRTLSKTYEHFMNVTRRTFITLIVNVLARFWLSKNNAKQKTNRTCAPLEPYNII